METLIIHTEAEKVEIIKEFLNSIKVKFEISTDQSDTESPYDPEFVAKIKKSRKDFEAGEGRVITIGELDSLWK